MKRLPILVAVVLVNALVPRVAMSDSISTVNVFLNDGGPGNVVESDQQSGLTSSVVFNTPSGGGAARTAPGQVGMSAAFPSGEAGGYATTLILDLWRPTFTGTGAPPATVPVTLKVNFDGTLDPHFLDPSLPTRPLRLVLSFRISGYDSEAQSQFQFLARYENGERSIEARFGDQSEGTFQDVTANIVRSGNHISLDHEFILDVPFDNWSERFDGQLSFGTIPGAGDLPVSLSTDFYSTFETTLTSNHPDVEFTSDGGRTTVPEPSGFILILPALAALRARRRR